jgi:hypothetical protein
MDAPLHPDTVATIIAHLNEELSVPVSSKVPPNRPAEFVTVQRTGGPQATQVSDQPQITIDCWANDDITAHGNAQVVRQVLKQMADGSNRDGVIVYRVDEFAGPAYLPDPDSRQDRFTFTVQAHTRTAPTTD